MWYRRLSISHARSPATTASVRSAFYTSTLATRILASFSRVIQVPLRSSSASNGLPPCCPNAVRRCPAASAPTPWCRWAIAESASGGRKHFAPAYGRTVTITYDEALRERIRAHLAGHDRRAVTDPAKRHAAVAVVLVDSEAGEDRVDPADLDDWIGGREMPEAGLDGRMVDVSGGAAFLLCRRASRLRAHAAQWALPGGRLD